MLQFRYFQLRNCGLIAYVVLCYGGEADQYRIGNCVLQHGGSGKKRTSSSWSVQPLRPLNSTEPETIPFNQRLGRRIFPPVNLEQSNLRLFEFLASLGLQTSNLGQCGTASSVVLKESPCPVFCSNLAELFIQSGV